MKYAMKALSLCLLLSAPMIWAKDKVILPDACGDDSVIFKVADNGNHPPLPALEPGKAMIVVGHVKEPLKEDTLNPRIGMDGSWIGALKNNKDDYFVFSAAPGEHHFCATFGAGRILHNAELLGRIQTLTLNVEAGHIYYFEARRGSIQSGNAVLVSYSFARVSDDDGKYTVKSRDYATSTPTK
jgi:hypothetical protein